MEKTTAEKRKKKTVLVTGAGGFVAGYLIRALQQQEAATVIASKLPGELVSPELQASCIVPDMNLLHPHEIQSVLETYQPEAVYHLAAQSSVAASWENPALTIDCNIKGTVHLLQAIMAVREAHPDYLPSVLLIGSSEEYGSTARTEQVLTEGLPLQPVNPYAVTKACQSMFAKMYADAWGMRIMTARPFTHIGAGQTERFVAASFAAQIAAIEAGMRPPELHVGNLAAKRDFSDVRDIVRGYLTIMQQGRAGEVYQIASGRMISIRELLDILLSESPVRIQVLQDESRIRRQEMPAAVADITKMQQLGWQPEIPLEQTLREMLEAARKKYQNQAAGHS